MKSLHKNNHGFAHIGIILLAVLAIAAIGGVGYYVLQKDKNTISPVTTQNTQPVETDLAQYESKELGFKFSYPKAWGEVKTSFNKKDIVESAQDSYWVARFSDDSEGVVTLKGASQYYSNSHAIDDIVYTSGFSNNDVANLPNCFGADVSGDKGKCQLVGDDKSILVAFFSELFNETPQENDYIVFNLKPNDYNIHAVRLSYLPSDNSKIKVTQEQLLEIAKTFQYL